MKKKGIVILLVLMLMVMIGCKAESQPQDEAPQATESNEVEQSAPIESDAPAEQSEKVEPMAVTLPKVSQEELVNYFQMIYDMCQSTSSTDPYYDDDFMQELELSQLNIFFDVDPVFEKPADLDAQYLAWREAQQTEMPAPESEAPSNNPQTQPITNNQPQPVSNQTGPGGATIVHDPSSDYVSGNGSLDTGGQRADFSQVKTAEEWGYKPSDPNDIIYGGGN